MGKDCYYFVQDGFIKQMCMKCYPKHHQKFGSRIWFWPGAAQGYGKAAIKCTICGEDISKGNYDTTAIQDT
jgi:hypothetical protein